MSENPIFAINARVTRLRADGADIVMLTAGEPQAPTAPEIVEAAQTAIADETTHHYGTPAGLVGLRRAIASRLPGGDSAWNENDVLVTSGAKHALYLAARMLTRVRDEVIVIEPGWPGHAAAVRAAGATPVTVRAEPGCPVTAAALAQVTTSRTRAVILASPANPTGTVLNANALRAIAEWAINADVWVISDDVYSAFDYTGTYAHIFDVAPHVRDRLIIVDSVSKEHAMTGWRVGWLAAPPKILGPARDHLAATITHVPVTMQAAASVALADHTGPARAKELYRARRDRLVGALDDLPGVRCPTPDGGMFVFPSVGGILAAQGWDGAVNIADRLLDAGVAVVPGEAFQASDRLRICYAVDDTTFDTAIDRLRTALTDLAKADAP